MQKAFFKWKYLSVSMGRECIQLDPEKTTQG
jgi:hypothetical protein